MEKKRRARINVSLEQLKTLLENNYSQNIGKRKLEKADILELTVKYMKTLQDSIQGATLLRSAEYQAGFRNCLNGVSQFLLRSEECSTNVVIQDLTKALPAISASCFSTKDSSFCTDNANYEHSLSNAKTRSPNSIAQVTKFTPVSHESLDIHSRNELSTQLSTNHRQNLLRSNNNQNLWRPW
ncbi:transcription factor HES-3 [Bombina bombina]|uniref:transcription factor HES-3 n=1 Tax=Bombina bombina TaxID=8345 RepID=UPI00235AD361|nr:transcription factor HES-3 [Bombina bombina]